MAVSRILLCAVQVPPLCVGWTAVTLFLARHNLIKFLYLYLLFMFSFRHASEKKKKIFAFRLTDDKICFTRGYQL